MNYYIPFIPKEAETENVSILEVIKDIEVIEDIANSIFLFTSVQWMFNPVLNQRYG
jgi:hypothetical protein